MDPYGTARLAAKEAESAIVARICEDFNLTPVLARAHYEQMARYFADYGHVPTRPGELCYLAVDANEPPGKPIIACRKLQVRLELATVSDQELLRAKGLAAMRQQRLARLARQAQVQGGLLTVEDLAYLTCSSPATVKRDLAACRSRDEAVPTRGQIKDIGPGLSHKAKVVQLYLWGLQFTDIESRTRHSEGSDPPLPGRLPPDRRPLRPGGQDPRDPGRHRPLGRTHRRVRRPLRAGPTGVPLCPPALRPARRGAGPGEKGALLTLPWVSEEPIRARTPCRSYVSGCSTVGVAGGARRARLDGTQEAAGAVPGGGRALVGAGRARHRRRAPEARCVGAHESGPAGPVRALW
jgi:hypothetical protein